jgi:hypothetical protein
LIHSPAIGSAITEGGRRAASVLPRRATSARDADNHAISSTFAGRGDLRPLNARFQDDAFWEDPAKLQAAVRLI